MSFGSFPLSQATADIIATGSFYMVYAAELFFKESTLRVHTGTGTLSIDGNDFVGIGTFGNVDDVTESTDATSALSVNLTLSGFDTDIIQGTSIDGCRGRNGKLYLVVISGDGTNQAHDILFSGRMDAARLSIGGSKDTNSLSVKLVDRMAEWGRTGTNRCTDESQQRRYAGDRFFYAVAQLADAPLYWGQKKDAPNFTYE